MSGLEIFGAVAGVVGILDVAITTYNKIKDVAGLPEAFRKVGEKLPLTKHILDNVQLQASKATDQVDAALTPVIHSCRDNAEKLKTILERIDLNDGSWSRNSYIKVIKAWGKKGRVEELMRKILEDVQFVAADRTMQAATAEQLVSLKDAIEELSRVNPSAPDELFDSHGSNIISYEGSGSQHNLVGDNNTMHAGSGHNFGDLRGATLHFGSSMPSK